MFSSVSRSLSQSRDEEESADVAFTCLKSGWGNLKKDSFKWGKRKRQSEKTDRRSKLGNFSSTETTRKNEIYYSLTSIPSSEVSSAQTNDSWESDPKGRGIQEGWILLKKEVLKAQETGCPCMP